MIDALEEIENFTAGLDVQSFEKDARTVAAVLYKLIIIGEAANQVPEAVRSQHPEVDWQHLRETRNIVTHVYFGVDAPRIWRIAKHRLPPIRSQLQRLLAEETDGSG
jgi:uncharacterized protein with HEPN domain